MKTKKQKKENGVLNPGDSKYVLSLKDLCTLDILPDILEAGVYSLKIEGRMKSPRYTAGVVRLYRKYVDLYLKNGRKVTGLTRKTGRSCWICLTAAVRR